MFDTRQEREFRSIPFARHSSDNIIIVSNPLSQSTMLWQALSGVLSEFLAPRYLSISTADTAWSATWQWLWLAPLVTWFVWVSRRRIRS